MAQHQKALTEVTRGPDRYVAIVKDAQGAIERVVELTAKEYADLALPGAGAPPGVTKEEWESGRASAAGNVPGYDNGLLGQLRDGEFSETQDAIYIGMLLRTAKVRRVVQVKIPKADVTVDRGGGGITLTKRKQEAWDEIIGLVSVQNGVLTTEDK